MKQVIKIDSEQALRRFIQEVDSLHDALLYEAALVHPGYVDQDGWMHCDAGLPNARLVFQSQDPTVGAVEVRMTEVSAFRICPGFEFRLEGEIVPGEIVLYLSGRQSAALSVVRAAHAQYQILGKEFWGPRRGRIGAEE